MIGHSMLIMLMTLIVGLGLWMFLLGGFEIWPGHIISFQLPGTAEGWARAHRGVPLNSLMLLGIAIILPQLSFSEIVEKRVAWIMILTCWANTIFYIASNFSNNRGLSFGANTFGPGDLAAFVALAQAFLFGLLSMVVLIMIARKAFNLSDNLNINNSLSEASLVLQFQERS